MKKWVKPLFLIVVLTLFLVGCSTLERDRTLIVIGDDIEWNDTPQQVVEQMAKHSTFEMKKEEIDGRSVVYISRLTADYLIDHRLLKVKTDKKYKTWRRIDSSRPMLSFAQREENIPEEIRLTTVYSGDLAIGDERFDYADVIIIATVDQFDELDIESKELALFQFKEERLAQWLTYFDNDVAVEAVKVVK